MKIVKDSVTFTSWKEMEGHLIKKEKLIVKDLQERTNCYREGKVGTSPQTSSVQPKTFS